MCGIVGCVGWRADPQQITADLRLMCDAIVHRGPDDAGYYLAPGVGLGMRRLSIIDVAGGHQPIGNEDGSVQVVLNGEIYNYRELRAQLAASHRFTTNSDTETIVHLYEDLGERVVDRLRGMYAFAIWDERSRSLLVARDRLGVKPLYYWETSEGLAFASELKALLRLPACPRDIDVEALADYLSLGYVPEPKSIVRGIRKLEPGHLLTWSREAGVAVRRYWTPFRPEDPTIDERQAVEEIRRLLSEAVRYRLISDVPLGAFLSGGIDSSAVVAEMARQMDRPVQTFSIGFQEPEFNEAPHAAAVAAALGTDHAELIVNPDVEALFEQVIAAFDEPFADSSAVPTLLVSQLARTTVTVVLSGDGGDEVFGGYTRYIDLARRGSVRLPNPIRQVLGRAAGWLPQAFPGRNRLLEYSRDSSGRYAGMVAHSLLLHEGGIARPEIAAAGVDLDHLLAQWFKAVPARDRATRASFVDLISYLPNDILTKLDRMSMAVSLEARVPLLDHHLVEFATSLPARFRWRDGTGKWVFRQAIRDLVPPGVLGKRKQGFGVPLRDWFRGPLRHRMDALLDPAVAICEFVEPAAVARIVREHQVDRRDHSPLLWKLLVLQNWLTIPRSAATQPLSPVALG